MTSVFVNTFGYDTQRYKKMIDVWMYVNSSMIY